MARKSFKATVGASLGNGQYVVLAASGGASTLDTTDLTTAIAAAQLIGTGDASAEIDAIDTAASALAVATSGDVILSYDASTVTSYNQLKRAVEALLTQAVASGMV